MVIFGSVWKSSSSLANLLASRWFSSTYEAVLTCAERVGELARSAWKHAEVEKRQCAIAAEVRSGQAACSYQTFDRRQILAQPASTSSPLSRNASRNSPDSSDEDSGPAELQDLHVPRQERRYPPHVLTWGAFAPSFAVSTSAGLQLWERSQSNAGSRWASARAHVGWARP